MIEISDFLARCLDDLESRINPDVEDELYSRWVDFVEGRFGGELFMPSRAAAQAAGFDWVRAAADNFGGTATARLGHFAINDALESYEMMALQQYALASAALESGSGSLMTIRSNYGTCIMPSLFGAKLFIMPESTNTLPTNYPLADSKRIEQLVERGMPDLDGGLSQKVFKMAEFFLEIARKYPKIGKYVHIMHPDTQGVMDVCELLWGSELLMAFYQEPQLVKALFGLVCDTYIAFMEKWEQTVAFAPKYNAHWGVLHKGKIVLRSDSVMNISPQMYEEFEFEHQERILNHFEGAIHSCGRCDHYYDKACTIKGLHSVNISQPECNDMEKIYAGTVDKGKTIFSLPQTAGLAAIRSGRNLHGLVHCLPS